MSFLWRHQSFLFTLILLIALLLLFFSGDNRRTKVLTFVQPFSLLIALDVKDTWFLKFLKLWRIRMNFCVIRIEFSLTFLVYTHVLKTCAVKSSFDTCVASYSWLSTNNFALRSHIMIHDIVRFLLPEVVSNFTRRVTRGDSVINLTLLELCLKMLVSCSGQSFPRSDCPQLNNWTIVILPRVLRIFYLLLKDT